MIVVVALTVLSLLLVMIGITAAVRRPRGGEPIAEDQAVAAIGQSSAAAGASKAAPAGGMVGLKRHLRSGEWRIVMPSLLVIGGLLGIMLFGAVALLIGLEQKATGVLMLVVAIFAAVKVAIDYRRA